MELNQDLALLAGDTITLRFSVGGNVKYLIPLLTSSSTAISYTECSQIPLSVGDLTPTTEELAEFVILPVAVVDVAAFSAIKTAMGGDGAGAGGGSNGGSSTSTQSELAATVQLIHSMSGRLLGVTKCDGTISPCTPNIPVLLPTSFESPCSRLLQHYDTVWDLDNHTISDAQLSQVLAAYQPLPYSAQTPDPNQPADPGRVLKNKPGFETTLNPGSLNSTLEKSTPGGMGYSDVGTIAASRGFAPFQLETSPSNNSNNNNSNNNNNNNKNHQSQSHPTGSNMDYMTNYYTLLNANNQSAQAKHGPREEAGPQLDPVRYGEHGEPIDIPAHERFASRETSQPHHHNPGETGSSGEEVSVGRLNRNGDPSHNSAHANQSSQDSGNNQEPSPPQLGPPAAPSNKWLSRQKQFNSSLNVVAHQPHQRTAPLPHDSQSRHSGNLKSGGGVSGLFDVGRSQRRSDQLPSADQESPSSSSAAKGPLVGPSTRLQLNSHFANHFTPSPMLQTLSKAFQLSVNQTQQSSIVGFNSLLARTVFPPSDNDQNKEEKENQMIQTQIPTYTTTTTTTKTMSSTITNVTSSLLPNDPVLISPNPDPVQTTPILHSDLILTIQRALYHRSLSFNTTNDSTPQPSFFQSTSKPPQTHTSMTAADHHIIIVPSHIALFSSTILSSLYRMAHHMSTHFTNINNVSSKTTSQAVRSDDDQHWLSWTALYLIQQMFSVLHSEFSTLSSDSSLLITDSTPITIPPQLSHHKACNTTHDYHDNVDLIDLFANASPERQRHPYDDGKLFHPFTDSRSTNTVKTMSTLGSPRTHRSTSQQSQLTAANCQLIDTIIQTLSIELQSTLSALLTSHPPRPSKATPSLALSTVESTLTSLHLLLDYIAFHSPPDISHALSTDPTTYLAYVDDLFASLNSTKPLLPLVTPSDDDLFRYMTAFKDYTTASTSHGSPSTGSTNPHHLNFTQMTRLSDYTHHTMAILYMNQIMDNSTRRTLSSVITNELLAVDPNQSIVPPLSRAHLSSSHFCPTTINEISHNDSPSGRSSTNSVGPNHQPILNSFTLRAEAAPPNTIPFSTLQLPSLPSPATPMPEFGDFGKILLDQQGFTSIFTNILMGGQEGLIPGLPNTPEAQNPSLATIGINSQAQANNIANNIDLAARDQTGFGSINDKILTNEQHLRFSSQQQTMLGQMMQSNPQVARHFENSPSATIAQAAQSSGQSTTPGSQQRQKVNTGFITLRTRPTETTTETTTSKTLTTPCRGRIDSFAAETPVGTLPTSEKVVGMGGEIDPVEMWSEEKNNKMYRDYFGARAPGGSLSDDYSGRQEGLYDSLLDSLSLRDRGNTYQTNSYTYDAEGGEVTDVSNPDLNPGSPISLDKNRNHSMSPLQFLPQSPSTSIGLIGDEWARNFGPLPYIPPPSFPPRPTIPIIDKIISAPSKIIPGFPPRDPNGLPPLPPLPSAKDLLDRIINFEPKPPPDYSTIFDPFNPVKWPLPNIKPPQWPSFPGFPDAPVPPKIPIDLRPPLPVLPPLPPIPTLPGLPGLPDYLGPVDTSLKLPPPDIMLGMMTRMFDIPMVSRRPTNQTTTIPPSPPPSTIPPKPPSPFDFSNYLRNDTHSDLLADSTNQSDSSSIASVGDIFFQATNALLQTNLPTQATLDQLGHDQTQTDRISTLSMQQHGKRSRAHTTSSKDQDRVLSAIKERLIYHLLSITELMKSDPSTQSNHNPFSHSIPSHKLVQTLSKSHTEPSRTGLNTDDDDDGDDTFPSRSYTNQPESRINQGVSHQFKDFEAQLRTQHKDRTMRKNKVASYTNPNQGSSRGPTTPSTLSSNVVAFNNELRKNQKIPAFSYHRPIVSSSGTLQSTDYQQTPGQRSHPRSQVGLNSGHSMGTLNNPTKASGDRNNRDGTPSPQLTSPRPSTQPAAGYEAGVYDTIGQRQMARSRLGLGGEIGTRHHLSEQDQEDQQTRQQLPNPQSSDRFPSQRNSNGNLPPSRFGSHAPNQQRPGQQRRSLIQNLRQSYKTDDFDRFSTITKRSPHYPLTTAHVAPPQSSPPLTLTSPTIPSIEPKLNQSDSDVTPPPSSVNWDLIRNHSNQIKQILNTHFSHIEPLQARPQSNKQPSVILNSQHSSHSASQPSPNPISPQLQTLQSLFSTFQSTSVFPDSNSTPVVAHTTTVSTRINACSLTVDPMDNTVRCAVTNDLCPKSINPLSSNGGTSFSTLSSHPNSHQFSTMQSTSGDQTPLWGLSRPAAVNPQNSFFLTESMTNINYDLDYASVNTFPYAISELSLRNFSPFEQFTSAKTAKRVFNTFIFRWSVGIQPIFTILFDSIPLLSLGPITGIINTIIAPILDLINGLNIPGLELSPLNSPQLSLNQFTVEVPFVWAGSRTVTEDSEYVSSYSITSPPSTHIIGRAMALVGRSSIPFSLEVTRRVFVPAGIFGTPSGQVIDFDYSIPGIYEGTQLLNSEYIVDTL